VASVWLGVVGVVGTVAGALVAGFFTWLTGKQARDHAENLEDKRFAHERQVAADTRRQDVYLRLLGLVDQVSAWAQRVKPALDSPPIPNHPGYEQQQELETIVGAFGSARVRQLYRNWDTVILEMIDAEGGIDREESAGKRGRSGGTNAGDLLLRLNELRLVERSARDALAGQINTELKGDA